MTESKPPPIPHPRKEDRSAIPRPPSSRSGRSVQRTASANSLSFQEQEQLLFEQRLCEDAHGVAVRKINQNGKATLRYVKCVPLADVRDAMNHSSRSVTSGASSTIPFLLKEDDNEDDEEEEAENPAGRSSLVLCWGRKKTSAVPLSEFIGIRKGKTTPRAKRNASPANRILSLLVSESSQYPCLDIEAPTQMDRDKFARAFGKFLRVPVDDGGSTHTSLALSNSSTKGVHSHTTSSHPPSESSHEPSVTKEEPLEIMPESSDDPIISEREDASVVSSLTGHAYDQEIVEEMHQALNELRAELEQSRAEASRAVKVAEHAIASAEKSNGGSWQNTVTAKAAEQAALAQTKAAQALQQARAAQEQLEAEGRRAAFWQQQAQEAQEEAGTLQTQAAAAAVQRAALEQAMRSLQTSAQANVQALEMRYSSTEETQQQALEAALAKNRALELELEIQRNRHEDSPQQPVTRGRKRNFLNRKKRSTADSKALLHNFTTSNNGKPSDSPNPSNASPTSTTATPVATPSNTQHTRDSVTSLEQVQVEAALVRQDLELLQHTTRSQLEELPGAAQRWAQQMRQALRVKDAEMAEYKLELAKERASRRRLTAAVQDLRGVPRVYCCMQDVDFLSCPSYESIRLHALQKIHSYEVDHVFGPMATPADILAEAQDLMLGALDGYNVCIFGHGPSDSAKERTMVGQVTKSGEDQVSITDFGVQLLALQQILQISKNRGSRIQDTLSMTLIQVNKDVLVDMLVEPTDEPPSKLEIRSDVHGDTVVQGARIVELLDFDQVLQIWNDALGARERRMRSQEVDAATYQRTCHTICTIQVSSKGIGTKRTSGTVGRLTLVDLASADLTEGRLPQSLEMLSQVVHARNQFTRSVPYRNSTLTHLLQDTLEADTKVLLVACTGNKLPETRATLDFCSEMRKVHVGKATKHILSIPT